MRKSVHCVLMAAGLSLLATAEAAPPLFGPIGAQFEVNTYTTNAQTQSSVAALGSTGNFVVVWRSSGSVGTDNSGYSVQGQRFNVSATPLGSQFQVNSYTTNNQVLPSVAADTAGNFVVTWQSLGSSPPDTDTSSYSVHGQRFNASATPQGGEFQVNTYTTSNQKISSVAMDSAGNFVVTWQSLGSSPPDTDTSGYSIHGQRFNASATPQGAQFQVNTYTTGGQYQSSVSMTGNGNFVVAWDSTASGPPDTDTSSFSVHGQLFNASATPQGAQFQVNTYTTNNQRRPSVAMLDGAGNFVVAWDSSAGIPDNSGYSVQGQRFNASATPQGAQFQVNTYTTNSQRYPSVAVDGSSNFMVTWESTGDNTDSSLTSVQGQRFNSAGTALGNQFQVNTYTTDRQTDSSVAADVNSGNFLVAWSSNGSTLGDSPNGYISHWSVQGQFFGPPTASTTNTPTLTPTVASTTTSTPAPPTSTATTTNTPVPPTDTSTATATATSTTTSTVTSTSTPTDTSTATATSTSTPSPVPPTATLTPTASGSSAHVVISQVYGGGGTNSSTTYKNDFIELFNGTGSAVDLSSWSVQYANAASGIWNLTALGGTLPAGRYYLVKEASQGVFGTPLPVAADANGTINVYHLNGKVALVNTTTALTGTCPSNANIIDFVGYGSSASCFEGTGPTTPDASVTTSVWRLGGTSGGCTDTDQNASDLIVQAASTTGPRNSVSAGNGCGGGNPTAIPSATTTATITATATPTNTATATATDTPTATSTPTGTSPPAATATSTTTPTSTPINTAFPTLTPTATAMSSSAAIVISQVYGGGGTNSGTTYHNDFIELFNRSGSSASLNGLSVQYANATASLWSVTSLPNVSVPAGGYFLVKEASQASFGAALPTADATGTINVYHLNGKVALVANPTPLAGACPTGSNILDLVGYGTAASCFEGTGPVTPDASLSTSVVRKAGGCQDTNQNGSDLQVLSSGSNVPRNSANPPSPCSGPRPSEQLDAPTWGGAQLLALLALGALGLVARRLRARTA